MTTPRQTVTITHVTAYDEVLTAEIAALEAQAATQTKQRMSEKPDTGRLDRLRKELADNAVRITFEALPRRAYRDLLAAHAPRPGEDLDNKVGYNTDTFGDALLQSAIIATTDLDGNPVPNQWDVWADAMSDGAWQEMFRLVLTLQRAGNPSLPL